MKKAKLLSITMIILVVLSVFALSSCGPEAQELVNVPSWLRGKSFPIDDWETAQSRLQAGNRYLVETKFTEDGKSMSFVYRTCQADGVASKSDPEQEYNFIDACALQGNGISYGGCIIDVPNEWGISSHSNNEQHATLIYRYDPATQNVTEYFSGLSSNFFIIR